MLDRFHRCHPGRQDLTDQMGPADDERLIEPSVPGGDPSRVIYKSSVVMMILELCRRIDRSFSPTPWETTRAPAYRDDDCCNQPVVVGESGDWPADQSFVLNSLEELWDRIRIDGWMYIRT